MRKSVVGVIIFTLLFSGICVNIVNAARDDEETMTDDKILALLDESLKQLPKKLENLRPDMRRVAFYQLRVDREKINPMLFKTIQGRIEDAFLHAGGRPTLVYSPELRPMKVVVRDDSLVLASGIRTSDEMRQIGEKLKIDGFLEGDLNITQTLYLNLRIIEAASGAVAWSESLGSSPVRISTPKEKNVRTDFGVGYAMIPLSSTWTASTAFYYVGEFRASQYSLLGKGMWLSLKGGFLMLANGINSGTGSAATFVSSPNGGMGGLGYFVKASVRFSILKNQNTDDRDWLSVDANIGKVFGGDTDFDILGVMGQCDLTQNFSLATGVYYMGPKDVKVFSTNVKAGGYYVELVSVRYWF